VDWKGHCTNRWLNIDIQEEGKVEIGEGEITIEELALTLRKAKKKTETLNVELLKCEIFRCKTIAADFQHRTV
jgi:hypothetical protein